MSGISKATILSYYARTMLRRRWSSRSALEQWQERRILRHVAKVRAASPFYRDWWSGIRDEDWRSFPVIDKAIMMENFDRLNTVGIQRDEALELALRAEHTRDFQPTLRGITIGLSSGTSGSRGLFLVSPQEQAAWTGTVLAKLLPRGVWRQERLAFFLRANSNLYESVRSGRLQFEYFDLLEPLELHIERLQSYQAGVWIAPPSMLRLLADARRQGRLTARPHRLIGVAEVLDPLDREVIEQAFAQPVHQAYQCTEGFLGATCSHGRLHLNEDVVHIEREYVDRQQRRFVPVVTDFSRFAQPIIRYRLNDLLIEAERACPCGSPYLAIEQIEGRCDDLLYFPAENGTMLRPVFPDFITRAVIGASPAIEHYHVIQHHPKSLELRLQVHPESAEEDVRAQVGVALSRLLARMGCCLPVIHYSPYMPVARGTKLRRVERRFPL